MSGTDVPNYTLEDVYLGLDRPLFQIIGSVLTHTKSVGCRHKVNRDMLVHVPAINPILEQTCECN